MAMALFKLLANTLPLSQKGAQERVYMGGGARLGRMEISRHSHYDHDIVGLQKTGRQAVLNTVKVWRPGLWRPLDQGRGDARNFHPPKARPLTHKTLKFPL